MYLSDFMKKGGCEGCLFYDVVDVDGRKDCTFHWYDDESDDWNYGKNCDDMPE